MANKTVSFRLPDSIIDAIDEHARISGKTRTDLIVEALAQAYDVEVTASKGLTIQSVQQQIDVLRQQIVELEQSRADIQATLQENTVQLLAALRQAIQPLQRVNLLTSQPDDDIDGAIAPDIVEPAISPVPQAPLNRQPVYTGRPETNAILLDASSAHNPDQLALQIRYQIQVFDQIFSAIPELVFICDRTGHFTYISPFGARVWGVNRDDLLGRLFDDDSVPAEFLDFNLTHFEATLSFGKLTAGEVYVSSSDRYYAYTLNPIQDESNTIAGAVGIALDITQHKHDELVMQASLERYRSLFELANDMIFIVDAETHQIIDANLKASRRLRYTRKELCQLTIEDIETPESAAHFQSEIVPKLEKTGSAIFIHSLRRKNGDTVPVEISVRLIEFGDRLAYQNFARDISERGSD